MALSLAACGGSSTTTAVVETPATDTPATDTPVTETPTTPVATSIAMKAATAGESVTGTAGADTITASTSVSSAANVLDGKDVIDGAAGADVLTLSLGADFAGFTAAVGSMTGVETVNISTTNSTDRSFDASGVTGVETYNIDGSKSAVALTDVLELAALKVSGQASGDMSLGWDAKSTVVTGSATDVMNVTVSGVGAANSAAATLASNATNLDLKIVDVETLALTSEGTANRVDTSGVSGATSITAAGAVALNVTSVGAAVTSVDASAMTANFSVDTTGTAATLTSIKAGTGDDTLTVSAADLAVDTTVAGGTGADTLDLASAANVTLQLKMTGVETIDARDISANTVTMSMSDVTDFTTINMTNPENATTNMAGTLKLINDTGATAITTTGAHAGTINTDTTGKVSLTAGAEAALTTAKTTATLSTAITAGASTELDLNIGAYVDYTGEVTAAKATTVSFTSGSTAQSDVDLDIAAAQTLTVVTGGAFTIDNSNSDLSAVQKLDVTAGKAVSFASENVAAAYDIDLAGTGSSSAVTLAGIGSSTLGTDLDIKATGLAGGLTTGDIDSGTAKLDIDVSGVTGAVSLASGGAINSDAAITIDATNVAGNVTLGELIGSSVSVDYTGGLGTLTLDSGADGTVGTVDITAKTAATVKGGALVATTADILAASGSTNLAVTLAGGAGDDKFSVKGVSTQVGITVTGDLLAGTGDAIIVEGVASTATTQTIDISAAVAETVTVALTGDHTGGAAVVTGSTASTVTDTILLDGSSQDDLSFTNIANVTVNGTSAVNASAFTGKTMTLGGADGTSDVLTINGTSTIDTIDLSGLTAGSNALALTIVGAAGADVITVHDDDVTIDGDAGADVITLGTGVYTIDINAMGDTFADAAIDTTASGGVTALTGIDLVYGFGVGDKIDIAGVANITVSGTTTSPSATATTELAAATANGVALVSGTFDVDAGTFTEGTYAASGANDYLFEFADGTNIGAIVLMDVASAIGSMTNGSDILTAVAP